MEFAIIKTGGKQYKVQAGQTLQIEKLKEELVEGAEIVFDKVLLVDNGHDTTIGMPYIAGAKVIGTFEGAGRAKKVVVMRYKQKSKIMKTNGHRQPFFKVKITAIKEEKTA